MEESVGLLLKSLELRATRWLCETEQTLRGLLELAVLQSLGEDEQQLIKLYQLLR